MHAGLELKPNLELLLKEATEAYRAGDYSRALALCQPVRNSSIALQSQHIRVGTRALTAKARSNYKLRSTAVQLVASSFAGLQLIALVAVKQCSTAWCQ